MNSKPGCFSLEEDFELLERQEEGLNAPFYTPCPVARHVLRSVQNSRSPSSRDASSREEAG